MEAKDPVLEKARELGLKVPVVQALHRRVVAAIGRAEKVGGGLVMRSWHGGSRDFCGTVHCHAGWVTHVAGQAGENLERAVAKMRTGKTEDLESAGLRYRRDDDDPTAVAAELIIRASCPADTIRAVNFYNLDDEAALASIRAAAALEPPIDDDTTPPQRNGGSNG